MKSYFYTCVRLPLLLLFTVSFILYPSVATIAQSTENTTTELTLDQKLSRLQFNFDAFVAAFIGYAKEKGETPEMAGTYLGRTFAPSWGDSLTAMGFVEGMNRNWQIFGIETEILESSPGFVKARHTQAYADEEFDEIFSRYGGNAVEYRRLFKGVLQGITDYHGLNYDEVMVGDWIVFTVSAN